MEGNRLERDFENCSYCNACWSSTLFIPPRRAKKQNRRTCVKKFKFPRFESLMRLDQKLTGCVLASVVFLLCACVWGWRAICWLFRFTCDQATGCPGFVKFIYWLLECVKRARVCAWSILLLLPCFALSLLVAEWMSTRRE